MSRIKARTWVRVHYSLAAVWLALVAPAVLFWKDSIVFVILLSLYANFIGNVSSAQAARAEDAQDGDT